MPVLWPRAIAWLPVTRWTGFLLWWNMLQCADCWLWMKPLGLWVRNIIQRTNRPWAHHQDFLSAFISFIINLIHALDTSCTVVSNEKYTRGINKQKKKNMKGAISEKAVNRHPPDFGFSLTTHPLWIEIQIRPPNTLIHTQSSQLYCYY